MPQAKGYLVASIEVRDAAKFDAYRRQVPAVIAAFGGRYVVRGAPLDVVEGSLPFARMVVVEFPSLIGARRFYESAEYAPLLKLRVDSTHSSVAFVEGYDAP